MKAYPISSFIVTDNVKDYLFEITLDLKLNTVKLFWHILKCSQMAAGRNQGWVAIPRTFINKFYQNADVKSLIDKGLLERDSWYSPEKQKCFRYRVPFDIINPMIEISLNDLENNNVGLYDLVKCKKVFKSLSSELYDENNNKVNDLVATRIQAVSICYFNKLRALKWVRHLKKIADETAQKSGSKSKEAERDKAKYINDCYCLNCVLLDCRAILVEGNIWAYKPPYKTQVSGRITHIGGGFQSASKKLQECAFYGIENYYNMDMVSSQPRCMIQLLEEAGLDASWLITYTNTPKAKHKAAECVGVSVEKWKGCLNAMLMGTEIPEINEKTKNRFTRFGKLIKDKKEAGIKTTNITLPAILNNLLKHHDYNGDAAFKTYINLYNYSRSLIETLLKYREWVQSNLIKNAPKNKKGKYIQNKAGALLYMDKIQNKELIRKIIAHLLQGMEAAFMSHLYRLSDKYGYKFVQDFHDGGIVKGNIPDAAVDEAVKLSGVQATLEEKPFENPFASEESRRQEIEWMLLVAHGPGYPKALVEKHLSSDDDPEYAWLKKLEDIIQ